MAKSRLIAWKLDPSGQYSRQVGSKAGKSGQTKFRLGNDLPKAQLAAQKLAMLWDVVSNEHDRVAEFADDDFSTSATDISRASWSIDTLALAEAIRKHHHIIKVGQPAHIEGPSAYAAYIDDLRQRYGHLISIQPLDLEAAQKGRLNHQLVAEHRTRQARTNSRIAEIPLPVGGDGATLYEAIDAYAAHALRATKRESGRVESATAKRLKDSTPDMAVSDFGYSALERLKQYWTARPEAKRRGGKGLGRPISLDTVDGHLSVARRFVRWLDRSDIFKWEIPRHGLDALKVNLQRLATTSEIAQKRHGVAVFNVSHLTTIYTHATDFERLVLLLGLNSAMSHAELTTLRWDEVEADPLTIKRIRHKSGVYGEFELWPETVKAMDWWRKVRPVTGELVMLTGRGQAYTRQRIANAWGVLHKRIQHQGDDAAWWLPFKHLRKTAAQLVRNESDGEIAGVFLSHGKPVATDDLADVYSNRPFPKVAEALKMVRMKLTPMFESIPKAFESTRIGRGE